MLTSAGVHTCTLEHQFFCYPYQPKSETTFLGCLCLRIWVQMAQLWIGGMDVKVWDKISGDLRSSMLLSVCYCRHRIDNGKNCNTTLTAELVQASQTNCVTCIGWFALVNLKSHLLQQMALSGNLYESNAQPIEGIKCLTCVAVLSDTVIKVIMYYKDGSLRSREFYTSTHARQATHNFTNGFANHFLG